MNTRFMKTEIFAFFILIFASYISTNAQNLNEIPAETLLRVRMDNEINSRFAGVNDTFTATLPQPLRINETIFLPAGTVVEGRITRVKRAAAGRNGSLKMAFETLRLANGEKRSMSGVLVNELTAESSTRTNVLTILGGTALGTIAGAVSKADNGWLIGAGLGGAAGTGIALLRKGKDVGIKADEEFEIKLTRAVSLPVQDF